LTPVGLGDAGFRYVGQCARLDRLTCMYCRETTDAATAFITNLPITYYYAGLTQITDRSLALLAGMPALEQIDLYECQMVTDAGVAHLARLPRLRQVNLDGLPGVTLAGTQVFAPGVKVGYTT
jgi:F-box/leucine-rich repeat protein 14